MTHKVWLTKKARQHAQDFHKAMQINKENPLNLKRESHFQKKIPNPFFDLFLVLKEKTIELLNKNQRFGLREGEAPCLSSSDMDHLESLLFSHIALQTKWLRKNLFILSTIAGLAPLLGLLGTVWGILVTFSELHVQGGAIMNQMVLGGLSLALTTTVLGLLTAIPALVAYNYLQSSIQNFEIEMEGFSHAMLSSIELYYRKVDLN
ncbi:MAG: MotA/TolQ/ExbB proton channel family protein [Waddliaceae bacterium]